MLIPHLDCITEAVLPSLLPPGVTIHVSRMFRTGPLTAESLREMNSDAITAAQRLPLPFLNLIALHCTSGTLIYGPENASAALEKATGLPAITTAGGVIEALKTLDVGKVCLVTPYSAELNEIEAAFLHREGFEVVSTGGYELTDSYIMQSIAAEEISLWARKAMSKNAEALFISCTSIRSLGFIDMLEHELGVPVVTSISATVWQILRSLRISERPTGGGRLFDYLDGPPRASSINAE